MWTSHIMWGVWSWAVQVAGGMIGGIVRVVIPSPYNRRPQHGPTNQTHNKFVQDDSIRVRRNDINSVKRNSLNTVVLDMDPVISNDLDNCLSPTPLLPHIEQGHRQSNSSLPSLDTCDDCITSVHRDASTRLCANTTVKSTASAATSFVHNESVVCSTSRHDALHPCNPTPFPSHENVESLLSCSDICAPVNSKHVQLTSIVLGCEDIVSFIDDDIESVDESSRQNASQVLEAVRGFTSIQSEMMKAIQEAKQATDTLTKPKQPRVRYSSISSIASGESLPSLNSLEKFLASSTCHSNGSSLSTSTVSSRNPSPSKTEQNSSTRSESDGYSTTRSSSYQDHDRYLEQDIENCLKQSNPLLDLYYDSCNILSSSVNEVQIRKKKNTEQTSQRPWSFDVSFLNTSISSHKNYSYKPQRLSNVNTLVELAKCVTGDLPQRPKTLDLKRTYKNYNSLYVNDNDVTITPNGEELLSSLNEESTTKIDVFSYQNNDSFLSSESRIVHSSESGQELILNNNKKKNCSIPILVTNMESLFDCNLSEPSTSCCDYESVDEDFHTTDRSCLAVKSISDSSGSDGKTWHDLSTSISDGDDNLNTHLSPVSSLNSPTDHKIPVLQSKFDVTTLRGEITALKKEILTRKGKVPSPVSKDTSTQRLFVSSVEDIGSLKNEITALKQDFLALLDDNAKSNLKAACKKRPKLKYTGKAMSTDCVDEMFKPNGSCLGRISSLGQMVSPETEEEGGFLSSAKKTKWNFDTKIDPNGEQISDVWFQTPNVKLSKGYIAKANLDSYDVGAAVFRFSGNSSTSPPGSLLLHQQLPSCSAVVPTVPSHEMFCPSTLRRLTEMLANQNTDAESDNGEVESTTSEHEDSSDDGFASDDEDSNGNSVELPCSVERVLYGLESPPDGELFIRFVL